MNIQDWFPLGWTGLTSLQSKGLSRVFSNTTVQKHQIKVTFFFIIMKYMFRFVDCSFIPGRKRGLCLQRWKLGWEEGCREGEQCLSLSLQAFSDAFPSGCISAAGSRWRPKGKNRVSNVPVWEREKHEARKTNRKQSGRRLSGAL